MTSVLGNDHSVSHYVTGKINGLSYPKLVNKVENHNSTTFHHGVYLCGIKIALFLKVVSLVTIMK